MILSSHAHFALSIQPTVFINHQPPFKINNFQLLCRVASLPVWTQREVYFVNIQPLVCCWSVYNDKVNNLKPKIQTQTMCRFNVHSKATPTKHLTLTLESRCNSGELSKKLPPRWLKNNMNDRQVRHTSLSWLVVSWLYHIIQDFLCFQSLGRHTNQIFYKRGERRWGETSLRRWGETSQSITNEKNCGPHL